MEARNVTVESTSSKDVTTRFGVKPTYSFKANDGNWYSTGFKSHHLNRGDVVSFDYDKDKFGNQVDMGTLTIHAPTGVPATVPLTTAPSLSSPRVATGAPSFSSKGVFPIPALDGQRAIIRQNALTNARELVTSVIGTPSKPDYSSDPDSWVARKKQFDNLTDEIIRNARKFEAYSAGDLDLEEVTAEMAADATKKAK